MASPSRVASASASGSAVEMLRPSSEGSGAHPSRLRQNAKIHDIVIPDTLMAPYDHQPFCTYQYLVRRRLRPPDICYCSFVIMAFDTAALLLFGVKSDDNPETVAGQMKTTAAGGSPEVSARLLSHYFKPEDLPGRRSGDAIANVQRQQVFFSRMAISCGRSAFPIDQPALSFRLA